MKKEDSDNLSQLVCEDIKKLLMDLLKAKTTDEVDSLYTALLNKVKFLQSKSSIDRSHLLESEFINPKESNLTLMVNIIKSRLLSKSSFFNDSDIVLHSSTLFYVLDLEL